MIGVAPVKVHCLQHVPFEGPGAIAAQGHQLTSTRFFNSEPLPPVDSLDVLIVLGGPMGVADQADYPWLATEKHFIDSVIAAGKPVLGICLGAQLIADVLGETVTQNPHREIGWFPVQRSEAVADSAFADLFPPRFQAFHWHGDTFSVPAGAIPIGSTEACANQGFIYRGRVIALQFHLETTIASAKALIEHCGDELDGSDYVQSAHEILNNPQGFVAVKPLLAALLEQLLQSARSAATE